MADKPIFISYLRFSSKKQQYGRSQERQFKEAEKYAKEQGGMLDKTLSVSDKGVSAWTGANVKKGALGGLLKLLEDGRIPKGSTIIVESLDRISRQDVLTALEQFIKILRSGITIHTTIDGRTFSADSSAGNFDMLHNSLLKMELANDESKKKSERLKDVWAAKRKNAIENNTPMTTKLPLWLRFNKSKQKNELIPGRGETIQRIFNMAEDGKGSAAIAKALNGEGVKSWNKNGTPWAVMYIDRVLNSKAVYGEAQLFQKIEGKLVPVGDPIKNYYEGAVDEVLFYKIKRMRKGNRTFQGKTHLNNNLFSGLLRCGYCGASMPSNDSKSAGKWKRYVACNNARREKTCPEKLTSFPKIELEKAFLAFVSEITYSDLIVDKEDAKQLKIKEKKGLLLSLQAKLQEEEIAIKRFRKELRKELSDELADLIITDMDEAITKRKNFEKDIASLENEITCLQDEAKTIQAHLESIKDLESMLYTGDSESYDIRCKLRAEIRQIIDKIVLFPVGLKNKMVVHDAGKAVVSTIDAFAQEQIGFLEFEIKDLKKSKHPAAKETIDNYRQAIEDHKADMQQYIKENTGKNARAAHIYFQNGAFREICFNPIDGYYVWTDIEAPKSQEEKADDFSLEEFLDKLDSDCPDQQQGRKKKRVWHPDTKLADKHKLINRILALRASGMKFQPIADKLNAEGFKPFKTETWTARHTSWVYRVYN